MHDSSRDCRVCDRIKAILLASEGWSNSMISQAWRIHKTTVTRLSMITQNLKKLTPENGGSQRQLHAMETMALIEHLTENTCRQIIKSDQIQLILLVFGLVNR